MGSAKIIEMHGEAEMTENNGTWVVFCRAIEAGWRGYFMLCSTMMRATSVPL